MTVYIGGNRRATGRRYDRKGPDGETAPFMTVGSSGATEGGGNDRAWVYPVTVPLFGFSGRSSLDRSVIEKHQLLAVRRQLSEGERLQASGQQLPSVHLD
jgi:hypothetical protein